MNRYYHLPTNTTSRGYNRDWLSLSGALRAQPITLEKLKKQIEKALQSEYTAIVLPENTLDHDQCDQIFEAANENKINIHLQLSASGLIFSIEQWRRLAKNHDFAVDIILDDIPQDEELILELSSKGSVHFILPGIKDALIWEKLKRIPLTWYEKLFCYFPYMGINKKIFKPRQVAEKLVELQILNPHFRIQRLMGLDIYEPRIDAKSELDCSVKPVLRTDLRSSPKISVVIPAYNNGQYLLNTLRHLDRQRSLKSDGFYDASIKQDFEVVVVDDGSTDETSELILQNYKTFSFAFTYLYYPRFKKRKMGDSQFRAGLARNLGVKWTRSSLLAFLDADIIVPETFIAELLILHERYSVVQWRREYLKKDVPSFSINYKDVVKTRDCFVPEGGYWDDFYRKAAEKSWSELPDYWKYTCTYGLSMPKILFKEAGWFRKTYCFYGCEDTELGLQLMRQGAHFYFHDVPVFHLFHETERSEYANSFFHRQKLLKNTAHIFYYNNLDSEVYRTFKYLLNPWGF